MKSVSVIVLIGILAGCAARSAPEPDPPVLAPVAVEDALFDPALVLDHQAALELDAEQVRALGDHMRATQTAAIDLEIRARAAREALATRLAADPIDEATAMTAARELADAETAIELAHLELRIRIVSTLRPDQRERLRAIRSARGPR